MKKPKISQEAIDRVKRYREDCQAHAKDCIKIRDHQTAQIVPFIYNRGQKILHNVVEKMSKDLGYIRVLLLKSRRFGGSTYVQARFYTKTSLHKNISTFIVAHEKESTNTLFEMTKLMQERNPLSPATRKSNEKLLRFDNDKGTGLKSEYRLGTAKNVSTGRSQGIHYGHGSEEAFWPVNAADLLNGLLQCFPDPPAPHEFIRESTANGFGNTFQTGVFEAYAEGAHPYYEQDGITYAWKGDDTDWVLVFIPWFVHERYIKQFKDEEQKQAFIGKMNERVFAPELQEWRQREALDLRKLYGLSWEQLHWRDWAIDNKMSGNTREERKRIFRQEYPATVEEAFLSRGSNVYSKELCDDLQKLTEKPIIVGEIVDRAGISKIKPSLYGKYRLWEKPDKRETYFITVDSGGGIKPHHEADNIEPDPSCIDVWNHRTGKQAAQWHGHIDYGMIANIVWLIGRMFFQAPACVELMNHGYTVVKDLSEMNYPLYEHRVGESGWMTTKRTKPQMVDDLGEMTRNGDIQIRSAETVSEMRTFVEKNGSYSAESGCKDDRVDAAAMGSQMLRLMPKRFVALRDKSQVFTGFANFKDREKKGYDGGYQEVMVG